MIKKIVITDVVEIKAEDYKIEKVGKYTHCYDCPFDIFRTIGNKKCYDVFLEMYGKTCSEIRLKPVCGDHNPKRTITLT